MTTGHDLARQRIAAHAQHGVLLGEAVGLAGLAAGAQGNLLCTTLSEAASVGLAAGLALAGKRPLVELLSVGGLGRAAEGLADAAARAEGAFAAPLVVLVVIDEGDDLPTLPPGVRLFVAGVPDDCGALVDEALARTGVSVVCLSRPALDGQATGQAAATGPARRREGRGATVLAEGAGVALALGVDGDFEVVDLRGERAPEALSPWLSATGRVVIVGHGDQRPLLTTLGGAFWGLESRPLALHAREGAEALAQAIAEAASG